MSLLGIYAVRVNLNESSQAVLDESRRIRADVRQTRLAITQCRKELNAERAKTHRLLLSSQRLLRELRQAQTHPITNYN
jgi:hypothetical protein